MNNKLLVIKTLQILSLIFLGIVLYVNFLSVYQPINGKGIKEISDKYSNLFTPAPITFTIWGLIYLGLIAYVVWQLKSLFSSNSKSEVNLVVEKIGFLFILSCVFNTAWIFAWQYEKLFFSVMIMIGLLLSLIEINAKISFELPAKSLTKTFLKIPFGLYLGWISIATISNVAAYLTKIGWNRFGLDERFWVIALVVVATSITCWAIVKLSNIAYGFVVFWSLFGILLVRINDQIPSLLINLSITFCALLVLLTISMISKLEFSRK